MRYYKNFYQIKSNEQIFSLLKEEFKTVGYFSLPYQDTKEIKDYALSISQENIVVLGIGGSSLGAKAIYKFLLPVRNFEKKLIFLDTIDPLKVSYCLKGLNFHNTHFIAISKSGNTIETITLLRLISKSFPLSKDSFTFISESTSALSKLGKEKNIRVFHMPENVGGRFSVFSAVGLVPLSFVGIDIDKLLQGARSLNESFFNDKKSRDAILNKARFYVENKLRFNVNVVFSYSSSLEYFNKWYIQLWAESLGKININGTRQALTPIGLIGPQDQHSFLQLIIDGVRDKTVTFIKINNLDDKTENIKDSDDFAIFDIDYLDNLSFSSILNYQADATIQSVIEEKDIPIDVITIDSVDELSISGLMFEFQILVSCIGKFLQINTYDQPGVEKGKIILKNILATNDKT